jgi:hypothetical protein
MEPGFRAIIGCGLGFLGECFAFWSESDAFDVRAADIEADKCGGTAHLI